MHSWLALCEGIRANSGSLRTIVLRFLPALGPEHLGELARVLPHCDVAGLAMCNVDLGSGGGDSGKDELSGRTGVPVDEPFAAVTRAFAGSAFDAQMSRVENPLALAQAVRDVLLGRTVQQECLQYVRLDHISIGNDGFRALCEALTSPDFPVVHSALAVADLASTTAANATNLLEVAAEGLGGLSAASRLDESSAGRTSSLTLSVEGCGISDGSPILRVLARNARLSTLNLSSNPLFQSSGPDTASFARHLGAALSRNSCLLALALDNTGMDDDALSALCANVEEVQQAAVQRRCESCDHALSPVAKFCAECGARAPIEEADTAVSRPAAHHHQGPLDQGPVELSLNGNDFAKNGVIDLSRALLSRNCAVRSLGLVHNRLATAAIESLSVVMGETRLRTLALSAPDDASTDSEAKLLALMMEAMAAKCNLRIEPQHVHDRVFAMARIRFPAHIRERERSARQAHEDSVVEGANANSVAAVGWGAQLGKNSKLARFMLRNGANE
jgi:hypothetical protein